jgi:formylglycine-generating enzyme required for sulfatase activity
MKRRFPKLVRFLCALCLAVWAAAPPALAQGPPRLGLQLSAGQPTLTITGTVGTVYSLQYASDLSPTNHWTDRTLVQVQGTSASWTDPSAPTPSQRFYRALSVPAPADTNLVFIQPKTFTMGSPTNEALRSSDETQHSVTISQGFWMEKYLVTQGDYLAVVGNNPSYFNGDRSGPPYYSKDYGTNLTRPVDSVSSFDATNYCALRTQQERAAGLIPTNYVYRLPTESEWEYAVRAATTTAFYLGSGLYSGQANFDGQYEYDASAGQISNPNGIYLQMTTPVGSYAPNPWGLCDMIGNLFEWCQDWYGTYPAGRVVDPQGPGTGSNRVLRGSVWRETGAGCRSAKRYYTSPPYAGSDVGFRVVLAPGLLVAGNGPPVDIALGQPSTESSTWSSPGFTSGDAWRANDGGTDGNYADGSVAATFYNTNAWWQVDLGSSHNINTIKVWGRTDCCTNSNYYVFVSDNAFTSTDLQSTLHQSGVSNWYQSATMGSPTSLSISRTGRYVRVQLAGTNYLSLTEVQVF